MSTTTGRRYETSHPWLSFDLEPYMSRSDLRPHLYWLLGKTCALIELMARTPLRPAMSHEMHLVSLVKGAQATTAIEGNTLTEEQVREVIESRAKLKPSKEYQAQEVRNVADGFTDIADSLARGHMPAVSPERIRELNQAVLRSLDLEEHVAPGEWRTKSVVVGPYLAPPAEDVDYLVKRMCDWMGGPQLAGEDTHTALIRAVLGHLYLEWIHPFGDGNGRTGRLLEFQVMLTAGLPTTAVHLLSNHYNDTRADYYRQLERASRNGGDFMPFLVYALQGLLDGLEEQHDLIREDLELLVWGDLLNDRLDGKKTATDQRRAALAGELYRHGQALNATAMLSAFPHLAPWYLAKTAKTLTRDLNALRDLDLIVKEERGRWRARREIIHGLRPDVAAFAR